MGKAPKRPESIPATRKLMREALQKLADKDIRTPCQRRPMPFTEVRQTAKDAAKLCGRGTDSPCPLLELCAQFAYTEGVHADQMVYGGYYWRRGIPETRS